MCYSIYLCCCCCCCYCCCYCCCCCCCCFLPLPLLLLRYYYPRFLLLIAFLNRYFKIATEVGVFQELAPMCFAALRESVFGGGSFDKAEDDDDEAEEYEDDCYGLSKKDLDSKGIAREARKTTSTVANESKVQNNNNNDDSGRQTMSTSFESLNNDDESVKTSSDVKAEEVKEASDASTEAKLDEASSPKSQNGAEASPSSKGGSQGSSRRSSNGKLEDLASRRRHAMRRTSSTLSQPLPDVHDSDDDDYEYHDGNKSVVARTVYLRTPSRDLAV